MVRRIFLALLPLSSIRNDRDILAIRQALHAVLQLPLLECLA